MVVLVKDASYTYDRFGSTGSRVGQAAYDIMSKDQPDYTAEEILDEMGKGIAAYIQEAAEEGCKKYDGKFFILHLFKKALTEHTIQNTMLQKAMCFKDRKWTPKEVMESHPNSAKTLYEVDKVAGLVKLVWTVPGWQDCKTIKKNPHLYDRDLVEWVKEATKGYQELAAS